MRYPQKPKKRRKHCWLPPHFIETDDDGTIENMIWMILDETRTITWWDNMMSDISEWK